MICVGSVEVLLPARACECTRDIGHKQNHYLVKTSGMILHLCGVVDADCRLVGASKHPRLHGSGLLSRLGRSLTLINIVPQRMIERRVPRSLNFTSESSPSSSCDASLARCQWRHPSIISLTTLVTWRRVICCRSSLWENERRITIVVS